MADSKYFGIPFATSGDKATIPEATQPSGAISFTQGFGPDYERDPATDPLAKRVPRDETNELYFQVTNALKFLQLYGTPEWYALDDAGNPVSYPISARVRHDAGAGMQVWRSLVATNTDTPGSDATKWTLDNPFDITTLEATLTEALAGTSGSKLITPRRLASATQRGEWNYVAAGGTATAITGNLHPTPSTYSPGMRVALKLSASIVGATTIDINGLGVVPVIRSDGTPLKNGDGLAGQVLDLIYDGSSFQVIGLLTNTLPPTNVLVFTTPGSSTWTVPDGVTRAIVEVIGAGGGGGGATIGNVGSGGAGGGYAQKLITGLTPGSVVNLVIGSGGAAGGQGGNGGTTSFGAYVSATGGAGGPANSSSGSAGGSGSGGDINITGQAGNGGSIISASAYMGGQGGGAPNGAAGRPFGITTANGAFNGSNGSAPGGGASGAASTAGSGANVAGGVGGAGQIVIRW